MELGYVFYSDERKNTLGHPRLDASLYEEPTGEHFDPHRLSLPIQDATGGIQIISIFHPVQDGELSVCIGKIILTDFVGKEIEAFSFGGTLALANKITRSFCRLNSPAPILEVNPYAVDELTLINEYEVELSMLRGIHLQQPERFEQHLANLDPESLFLSLSQRISHRLERIPAVARGEAYWRLIHSLHAAIRFVQPDGNMPAGLPDLEAW